MGALANNDWEWCGGTNWQYGTTGTSSFGPYGPGVSYDYSKEGRSFCGDQFGNFVVQVRAFAEVFHPVLIGGGGYWTGGSASVSEQVPQP